MINLLPEAYNYLSHDLKQNNDIVPLKDDIQEIIHLFLLFSGPHSKVGEFFD